MDSILWFMHSHRIIILFCTGLELLKMTYVMFSGCFSCTKRPKMFLVGALDLIFGVPGLTVIVVPIVFSSASRTFISYEDNIESALLEDIATPLLILCGFPTLTGFLTMAASSCRSKLCAKIALVVRSLIILMWTVVIVVFTLFYINYYGHVDYSESELYRYFFSYIKFFFGAPGSAVFAQLYFIHILVNFCQSDLKQVGGGGGSSGGSSSASGERRGEGEQCGGGPDLEQRPLTEAHHPHHSYHHQTWINIDGVGFGIGGPKGFGEELHTYANA